MIVQIHDKDEKRAISRKILESLKEWFEVDESREQYIAESADRIFFISCAARKKPISPTASAQPKAVQCRRAFLGSRYPPAPHRYASANGSHHSSG